MKKYQFNINGFDVEASYSNEFIEDAQNLIQKWLSIESDQRIIIFLAAPPAAGKSTMAALFEYLSNGQIQALGMDGFHRYQSYILDHTVCVDGKDVPMKSVKGCPESFDYERFVSYIKKIKYENGYWPLYNRVKHDVEDDQIFVDKKVVLIEGNYLLLNEKPWNELKQYCDESIFIETNEEHVRQRLIKRKIMGGSFPHEAVHFYKNSDGRNVRRILEKRLASDYIFVFDGESYTLK